MIGGDGINDESNKTAPAPNLNFLLNKNKRSGSHESGSRLALVGTVPATSGTCAASPSPAMIRLIAFSETPVPGAALILRYP